MNTQSDAVPESPMTAGVSAPDYNNAASTRPFYWSLRREAWENRSIYIAPLIVAAVILSGMLVSARHLPQLRRKALLLDPAHQRAAIELPYDIAATMIILTAFIVGVFYCLDALHGERRDRSILFWKSLPVSDFTSVLSKVMIPLMVLPVIILVIIVATQFIMLLLSSAFLLPSGLAGTTWANFNLFQQSLISGLARRATFLWAVLPLLAIGFFEKITFNSSYFGSMLKDRLLGFAAEAFNFQPHHGVAIDSLTPGRYLSSPGLWLGLVFAAICVAAAIRLRCYRGPL
jgi:ABC-2 type transport system permease protein